MHISLQMGIVVANNYNYGTDKAEIHRRSRTISYRSRIIILQYRGPRLADVVGLHHPPGPPTYYNYRTRQNRDPSSHFLVMFLVGRIKSSLPNHNNWFHNAHIQTTWFFEPAYVGGLGLNTETQRHHRQETTIWGVISRRNKRRRDGYRQML